MNTNPQQNPRTQELRLRRRAQRQGMFLSKNGRKDPLAIDYGYWRIFRGDALKFQSRDLDAIEAWLSVPHN